MAALEQIKVFVCHDNSLWQAGLVATLERHCDIACAAGADMPPIHRLHPLPDVVVADYCRGIELAAAVAAAAGSEARPRVVIVTLADRECEIRAALTRGVQGYLLLGCAPDEITAAIRATHRGEHVLSPKIASRLAENLTLEPLTQREEAVLRLLVEGLCNKAIGNRLGITAGTVKSHLSAAFGKLGVMSRTQAVASAQRRGLFETHAHARPVTVGRPRSQAGRSAQPHQGAAP